MNPAIAVECNLNFVTGYDVAYWPNPKWLGGALRSAIAGEADPSATIPYRRL